MINKVFKFFKALGSNRDRIKESDCGVLFIPSTNDLNCAVSICYDFLEKIKSKRNWPPFYLISEGISSGTGCSKVQSLAKGLNRIVLFAHPNENMDGFKGSSGIDVDCFKMNGENTLLYAHVCEGSKVLNNNYWKKPFDECVTYREVLNCFMSGQRASSIWKDVLSEIVEKSTPEQDVDSFCENIELIYTSKMSVIYDDLQEEEGDLLNLLYLQKHLESVVKI